MRECHQIVLHTTEGHRSLVAAGSVILMVERRIVSLAGNQILWTVVATATNRSICPLASQPKDVSALQNVSTPLVLICDTTKAFIGFHAMRPLDNIISDCAVDCREKVTSDTSVS